MFDAQIVGYLFLGGAGAGACFILSLMTFMVPCERISSLGGKYIRGVPRADFSTSRDYRLLFAPSYACALLLLVVGVAFLILDLGRIDRVLLLFSSLRATYLSVGAYALFANVLCAGVLGLAWGGCFDSMGLVPFRIFAALALVASAIVVVYTGLLLQNMNTVPFWSSPWVPVLFVLSSVSCGLALIIGVSQFSGSATVFSVAFKTLVAADCLLIVSEAAAAALFISGMLAQTANSISTDAALAAVQSTEALVSGPWATLFWGGFAIGGLALPLVLEASQLALRKLQCAPALLSAFCILAGGFVLRYCIVGVGIHPIAATIVLG